MATRSVPKNQSKWEAFRDFVWDSENKTIIGRNAKSWVQITIFYIILYILLAGFFIGCMTLFFKTTNVEYPNRVGMASPMKFHPGMSYRPLNGVLDFIKFEQGNKKTSQIYIDGLDKFFQNYENQTSNVDCSKMSAEQIADSKQSCLYKIKDIPVACQSSPYGYTEGTPCFVVTLNKVYKFVPELAENSTGIEVTCEGISDEDKKNIDFEMTPTNLDRKFFPYLNQEGYVSPYIVVKVNRITAGKEVNVWCKAHANNLVYHRNDRAAGVTFTIRVE